MLYSSILPFIIMTRLPALSVFLSAREALNDGMKLSGSSINNMSGTQLIEFRSAASQVTLKNKKLS